MMRMILISVLSLFFFVGNSQELTVFYKEKSKPAQSLVKESVDYSQVTLFFSKEMGKLYKAIDNGMNKDSIPWYEQEIQRKADSVFYDIKRKADEKKPLKIPTYDYVTILKVNKNKSLYYSQNQVDNDTISRANFNEKGEKSVDARINYNDS